jgi:tyrosine-protein kinase Etk/Wzc
MATQSPVHDVREQVGALPAEPLPGAASQKDDDGISLLDLLIVLAERKRLIFWITVGFAIAALIVSLLLPKHYTATASLLTPQQNSSLSAQLASQLGALGPVATLASGGGGSLLRNPNEIYVGMLRSQTVEDAMIEHFGLMQEYHTKSLSGARIAFEKYANVDGSQKDGFIHISVDDRDPVRAAALANGYVDQFRALTQNLAITEAQRRRLFFENQLKQANQDLGDAEEAMKATEQKTGVIQLDSQTRALIESAAALRAQIATKEMQIQGMQTYANGENAPLKEAEQELASLRAQLAKLGGSADNPDSIIVPKGQMTDAGVEYIRRVRDVKYYETIFDVLARQFELAKLDEAREGVIIQVVDPAIPPDRKSSPKRAEIVVVATAVGFLLGLLSAFVLAIFEHLKGDPMTAAKLESLRKVLFRRGNQADAT